jgi:hypothetical protein
VGLVGRDQELKRGERSGFRLRVKREKEKKKRVGDSLYLFL